MAIADSLYAAGSFDGLQVGKAALHTRHPAHLRLSSSLIPRAPRLRFVGLLEKGDDPLANLFVRYAGERHMITRHKLRRVLKIPV